ncbi:5058_t:CDS:2 [Scutellospora calospora]|uniref:5058_t:CDS:1 n=1 Tax=Scutellospora calospora TaxID=85575 RepID=A0ACA9KDI3_9GLOM|nr:5058_t:CDS:2 [Scutellospora calospora]
MSKQLLLTSVQNEMEVRERRRKFTNFATRCFNKVVSEDFVFEDGKFLEFDEPIIVKHDKPIKDLNEEQIENIRQLNLIYSICESIEKDKDIDKTIKYNANYKKMFGELERVLTNPTESEREILMDKNCENMYNIHKDKELDFPMLKKNIDGLPDYIFKRIDLLNIDHKALTRSYLFDSWCCNIVNGLTDKTLIEKYFNIDYNIFENSDMKNLSLIIAMNKIGFNYSQFIKVEEDPINDIKELFENDDIDNDFEKIEYHNFN